MLDVTSRSRSKGLRDSCSTGSDGCADDGSAALHGCREIERIHRTGDFGGRFFRRP